MKNKNAVKKFYDKLSENFDNEQNEKRFEFVRNPEKEIINRFIEQKDLSSASVLEIGAGTGRFSIPIAKKAKKVLAVDISEEMLGKLKDKAKNEKLQNIETISGDFMEIDIKEKFDFIVSFSAVEYIKNKSALFEKISSLLKPDAEVFITTAHNSFFRLFGRLGNYFRQKVYMNVFSKKEVARLCKKYNLLVIETKDSVMKSFCFNGILLKIHAKKIN